MSEITEHSGIILRDNLTLFVWSDETKIEVFLTPEQAFDLSQNLYNKALSFKNEKE